MLAAGAPSAWAAVCPVASAGTATAAIAALTIHGRYLVLNRTCTHPRRSFLDRDRR
jgi:hypothetical protein